MRRADDTPGPTSARAPDRRRAGSHAEDLAASYLQLRGYSILIRNYRDGPREIDLVASFDRWLVVVEVRYRSRSDWGSPEETVRFRKRRNLRRAGQALWLEHAKNRPLRFDLIAIEQTRGGLNLRHHPHFMSPTTGS